jgi:mannose-6-phosphate isomerase-like protein (cupin superfamily)
MPSSTREQLDVAMEMDGYEARMVQWGDTTVIFDEASAPADPAPLFKGLPDDRCQCEHYGYVLDGEIIVRYADSEEVITAGAAYYIPPGHLPLIRTSAKTLEFTKTADLNKTMETVSKNVAAGAEPIRL